MWTYIKQSGLSILYLFFTAIISFGIICIDIEWIEFVLLLVNVGMYLVIVGVSAHKDGVDAYKVLLANDLERMEIVRTGEDRPLKLQKEYKPWKGFFIGFIACIPEVILMIIHTILVLSNGPAFTGAGAIAGVIYMVVFSLFSMWVPNGQAVPYQTYYGTLIIIPILVLTTGIFYYLGAKKVRDQQRLIKQKHSSIYGN